jgi:dihydrofolate reductase
MRKVKYSLASSLDNFIAREDGSVDWLALEGVEQADFAESFKSFDAVLMGRKTYEFGLSQGMAAYPKMENYVFSRTLKESADKRVEVVAGDACEFVRSLKNARGGDIWLCGGGSLAASLLAENLIDEIELTVYPILLGSGIPFFSEVRRQIELELTGSKTYKNLLVTLSYRVK